jgi:uncharacterized protein YndB with AHSA1/START domain
MTADTTGKITLVVRESIRAKPERLFAAWTEPEQLKAWWGPENVTCIGAEVELRVGGRYRIGNRFPDGKVLWIAGRFESIEAPRKLVYTWSIEGAGGEPERVTVEFEPLGELTEVRVTHERIADEAARDMHRLGWQGCLQGLQELLAPG